MSNPGDFVIENGVLKKYVGPGGDVVVPEGVTSVGDRAFFECVRLTSITLPEGVTSIGKQAFSCCISLASITLPEGVTSICLEAFGCCDSLTSVLIPNSVTSIDSFAFSDCGSLISMVIPESVTSIGRGAFWFCNSLASFILLGRHTCVDKGYVKDCRALRYVLATEIPFEELKENGLGMLAASAFILNLQEFTDASIVSEYVDYISSQRKKLLPNIFAGDHVEILQLLAEAKKITKKNLEPDYLLPAMQCGARKCIAFLESVPEARSGSIAKRQKDIAGHELWDGIHFSLDGKKLLKYKDVSGQTTYDIPDGTKEICKAAFFRTALREIHIPESVTTIRNGAFTTRGGQPLYIRLPKGLKRPPAEAFWGGFFSEDGDSDGADWQKYYFIATSNLEFIPYLCCDSYSKGCRCPIYTGGEIDDLQPREKLFAVKGFLYALQTGVEDMSRWRTGYLEHIRRNEKTYVKQAAEDDFLLHLMIDEKLLSASGAKQLISTAEKNKDPERIAALLAYQSIQFGAEDTAQDFSLSDDDPEMKRMLKMAARKEQIRDQKGITGLIFVCTGDLDHFGYVDEYTGARDFGDLKAYIEDRGGFLRSAVSSKTDYLICNDPSSQTIKSKKAKELGTSVITEEEFLRMADEA